MEDENLNIATSRRARAGVNPEPGTGQFRINYQPALCPSGSTFVKLGLAKSLVSLAEYVSPKCFANFRPWDFH
jgi:hypothetical protein